MSGLVNIKSSMHTLMLEVKVTGFLLLTRPGRDSMSSSQLLELIAGVKYDSFSYTPVSLRSLALVRACRSLALSPPCGSSLHVKIISRLCERRSLMSL